MSKGVELLVVGKPRAHSHGKCYDKFIPFRLFPLADALLKQSPRSQKPSNFLHQDPEHIAKETKPLHTSVGRFIMTARASEQTMAVRKGLLSDANAIAALGSHVFSVSNGSIPSDQLQMYLDNFYSPEAIGKDITNPLQDVFVATDADGTIVGFAQLTQGTTEPCVANLERTIELQRLYVHLDYHGKGIGRLLSDHVETHARTEGFRNIWLGTWEDNLIAQKVYSKLGYVIVGDHEFVTGTVRQTDYIMAKQL